MLKPISRDTLTQQSKDTIKRFILEEKMPAGSQLPSERELSETLAVSRNIIREALSALEAEGIVRRQVGKGTFVGDFDRSEAATSVPVTVGNNVVSTRALREARAALEIGAVGLIVQRITDEEIAELRNILSRYEQKHAEGKSTVKDDVDFHLTLLRATKNEVIIELAPLVVEMFRRTLVDSPAAIRHSIDRIWTEHRQIIEALEKRDLNAAREVLHKHYHLDDFPI